MTTVPQSVRGELVVDTQHQFRAMGVGPLWECRYRVYAFADGIVVVLQDAPGSDLPVPVLHVEQICSEVLPNVVESPSDRDRVSWVVQLPGKTFPRTNITVPEIFAQVIFLDFLAASDGLLGEALVRRLPTCKYGWLSRPEWSKIALAQLESVIGMPWDPAIPAITSPDQWRETR